MKIILIVILSIALVGTWGYLLWNKNQLEQIQQTQQSQIAKVSDAKTEIQKNFDDALLRLDSLTMNNNKLLAQLTSANLEVTKKKAEIRSILNKKSAFSDESTKAKKLINDLNTKIVSLNNENEKLKQDLATTPASKTEINIKKFDIPYPKPSSFYQIPWNKFSQNIERNFITIDSVLSDALLKCGYLEKSYYYVAHGFALVTQLEQINEDGTSKQNPERWSTRLNNNLNDFRSYLKSLVHPPKGYFRVIVFLVTDVDLNAKNDVLDEKQAKDMVLGGNVALPASYRNLPFTNSHRITALIYEYKITQGIAPELVDNEPPGELHLEKAGIINALK